MKITANLQRMLQLRRKYKSSIIHVINLNIDKLPIRLILIGEKDYVIQVMNDLVLYRLKYILAESNPYWVWEIIQYFKDRGIDSRAESGLPHIYGFLFNVSTIVAGWLYRETYNKTLKMTNLKFLLKKH